MEAQDRDESRIELLQMVFENDSRQRGRPKDQEMSAHLEISHSKAPVRAVDQETTRKKVVE